MALKERLYWSLVIGGVVVLLLPAIVGGGLIIGGVLVVVWLVAMLGGPKAWELYNNKAMGERGMKQQTQDSQADLRNLINYDPNQNDKKK